MRKPTLEEIDEHLMKMGICPGYLGVEPLKRLIKIYSDYIIDKKGPKPLLTTMYIKVANDIHKENKELYNFDRAIKNGASVERNVRTAIERVWDAEPWSDAMVDTFRYCSKEKKPTNFEFVNICAKYLTTHLQEEPVSTVIKPAEESLTPYSDAIEKFVNKYLDEHLEEVLDKALGKMMDSDKTEKTMDKVIEKVFKKMGF